MPSIILKCCVLALVTGILALLLREIHGGQWALFCVITGAVVLFIFGLSMLEEWLGQIRIFIEKSGIQGKEWGVLLKGSLICICVDFTAEFCKSTGQPLLAQGLEMVGRVCMAILAIPFIVEILSMVEGILQA